MAKKQVSQKTREKMRQIALKDGRRPPSRKGAKHSEETRKKMSRARAPEGPWRSSLRHRIRNCYEYRQWRSDIFERDNYTCFECGDRSKAGHYVYLQADHYPQTFASILDEFEIKSMEDAVACERLWNLNNGRTLCKSCHYKETSRFYSGKDNPKTNI